MAEVCIIHEWGDGSRTITSIEFEDSYPDAMSRACDEAVRCWMATVAEDGE